MILLTDETRLGLKRLNLLKRRIKEKEKPIFEKYNENISRLKQKLRKYQKYKNIIVIAQGGSFKSA